MYSLCLLILLSPSWCPLYSITTIILASLSIIGAGSLCVSASPPHPLGLVSTVVRRVFSADSLKYPSLPLPVRLLSFTMHKRGPLLFSVLLCLSAHLVISNTRSVRFIPHVFSSLSCLLFKCPSLYITWNPLTCSLWAVSQVTSSALTLEYLFFPPFFIYYVFTVMWSPSFSPLLSMRNRSSCRFLKPSIFKRRNMASSWEHCDHWVKVTARSNLTDTSLPLLTFIILQCHRKPNTLKALERSDWACNLWVSFSLRPSIGCQCQISIWAT